MLRTFCLLSLLFLTSQINAQTVDLLRLGYDEKTAVSQQSSLTVSNDGTQIAFIYENKTIKILNATSGKVSHMFTGVHDDLFEIRFDQPGKRIISVGDNNKVSIINIASGEVEYNITTPEDITRVAISPTENILALGTKGSQVLLYDLNASAELVRKIGFKMHHVSALDFDPTGKNIVVCYMPSMRKKVEPRIYSVKTGIEQASIDGGIYYSAKYTEDGKYIILGAMSGVGKTKIFKYDTQSQVLEEAYKKVNMVSLALYTSIIERNGYVLLASIDKAFEVVDFRTSEIVYSTKREKTKLGQLFAKMGIDKTRIYPLAGGKNFLVNYSGSNVNAIYNSDTKNIQAYIYSDANNDLVTVTRDGRLDGSIEAIAKVYWTERKSNKQVSLESTFDKYYTPRLLPSLLSGEEITILETNLEEDITDIPVVSISSSNASATTRDPETGIVQFATKQKNIAVTVKIDSFPENTTEVKLFHNGKLKAVMPYDESSSYTFPVTLNTAYGNKNFFFGVASTDNGIDSEKAKMLVNYEADSDAKPKLYVMIIGVNNYKNPRYQLNYALSDAQGIEEIVTEGQSSLFDKVEVHTLYDQDVTKDNVLAKFSELGGLMNEQDVFMFYYAGHGTLDKDDAANEFYIVPYDIVQLYGNSEMLKEKAISASEMRDISVKLNPQKQVFIIDACHSAGALESSLTRGAAEERAIAQLARSTGTFWLTAAGSEQFATEFEELGHGVFTYTLLEALTGKNNGNGDGTLTIRELSSYVEMRVPELSEQYKGQAQYPASFSFGNDFPIRILND